MKEIASLYLLPNFNDKRTEICSWVLADFCPWVRERWQTFVLTFVLWALVAFLCGVACVPA